MSEQTYPTKVLVKVLNPDEWEGEQRTWIDANQGKEVTGKMKTWDEFQPEGAPCVLYEDEYEVIESEDMPPFPCPVCGEEYDKDCQGRLRCVTCDGPCPDCSDGPGPGEDGTEDEEDDRLEFDTDEEHEHVWGPVERARITGNPHRKCQVPGCREITLDLEDGEEEDGD